MSTYNEKTNPFKMSDIEKFSDKYKKYIEEKILDGIEDEKYVEESHGNYSAQFFNARKNYNYTIIPFSNGGNRNKMSKKTKYNKTNNKNKNTKTRKRM